MLQTASETTRVVFVIGLDLWSKLYVENVFLRGDDVFIFDHPGKVIEAQRDFSDNLGSPHTIFVKTHYGTESWEDYAADFKKLYEDAKIDVTPNIILKVTPKPTSP